MSHISSIGAGLFTTYLMSGEIVTAEQFSRMTHTQLLALFAGGEKIGGNEVEDLHGKVADGSKGDGSDDTITYPILNDLSPNPHAKWNQLVNLREIPAIGTPPNLTNVPEYGSKISKQIQAQADPESTEITTNLVPAEWIQPVDSDQPVNGETALGQARKDKKPRVFAFVLVNAEVATKPEYALTGEGLGKDGRENTIVFFVGAIESYLMTPSLSHAPKPVSYTHLTLPTKA